MTHSTPLPPAAEHQLSLSDSDGLGTVAVDLQAFLEFSFWIAEELDDLVSTHVQRYGLVNTGGQRASG